MSRVPLLILSLATLAGCAAEGRNYAEDVALQPGEWDDATDIEGQVRIDVYPPEALDTVRGPVSLRSQTFVEDVRRDLEVSLVLTPAVTISGTVTGTALTPWPSAEVPTVDDVLANAALRFGLGGTAQQPRTETDADGRFTVAVVPSDIAYDLAVIPETTDVPLRIERVTIDGSTQELDLHLVAGVPVWGTVTDPDGAPLTNIELTAVGPTGLESAPTTSDVRGRYELIVAPEQAYTVVARPIGVRVLPDVRVATGVVSASGIRADVPFSGVASNPMTGVVSLQRLVDGEEIEQPVSEGAVRVRIISQSLDGYADGEARFEAELGTNGSGRFTEIAPAGFYRVEVAPQALDGPSPLVVEGVRVGSGNTTTTVNGLSLSRKTARQGRVLDEDGTPVGLAQITCTELGFAERSFSTTADPEGGWVMSLPDTPVRCAVTPPIELAGALAVTWQRMEDEELFTEDAEWTLRIREGSVLSGQVRSRGEARLSAPDIAEVASAVVEVLDSSGNLLGVAITDSNGQFRMRIDR